MDGRSLDLGRMFAHLGRTNIIAPAFVVGLVVVALGSWWVARRLGRRSRRVGVAAILPALLLTTLAGAGLVNFHYEYLPRLDDAVGVETWPSASVTEVDRPHRSHVHGAVVRMPIAGTRSGFGTRTAMVYLPPQYFTDPTARFPVAYLLHGAPGAPVDWFRAGDAAQAGAALAAAGRPAILVAPKLSRSWLDDSECVDGASEHVETYFTRDVVPAVDARLRTKADPGDRLLVGISAGGYCALNLGLRHRDEFRSIADLSGLDRPTHDGGARALFGPRTDLAAVERAQTPVAYVPDMAVAPKVDVYLACGRHDTEPLHDTLVMDRELRARDQAVTLALSGGSHDFAYWRHALPAALSWWRPA